MVSYKKIKEASMENGTHGKESSLILIMKRNHVDNYFTRYHDLSFLLYISKNILNYIFDHHLSQ